MAIGDNLRTALKVLLGSRPEGLQLEYGPTLTSVLGMDEATLWRTQPHLRTLVTFLARNVAQLGFQFFERVSDTDRQRIHDDPLVKLLRRPNNHTTTYELIFGLVADLALYDEAIWMVFLDDTAPSGWTIEMISPSWIFSRGGASAFTIDWIKFRRPGSHEIVTVQTEDLLWFHGWNPGLPRHSSSPIEALKQILAEQISAQAYREQIWRRGGRVGGFLTRPAGTKWESRTREKFQRQWQAKYSGNDGAMAGSTPILEDGMTYNKVGFSAHEDDYVEGSKLAFATVAAVYHVNPTMVGLLDNANFSNVREFRSMLYGDTLGSTISMIEDRINTFLAPRVSKIPLIYGEFNIGEKLQGTFEEQATALSTLVGRPLFTANEGRAKLNMPALDGDANQLVTPLNVLVGGQASPQDSGTQNLNAEPLDIGELRAMTEKALAPRNLAAKKKGLTKSRVSVKSDNINTDPYVAKATEVLTAFFKRQQVVVLSQIGAKAKDPTFWDATRWDKELGDDLFKVAVMTATELGQGQAEAMGYKPGDYDETRTIAFLKVVAASRAGAVNAATLGRLQATMGDGGDPGKVFDEAVSARTGSGATALIAGLAGFAVIEAGKQLIGDQSEKTWNTGANPRPDHAAMDGETVGINETFSNGADWPGDPTLGAEGVSNCNCGVTVSFGNVAPKGFTPNRDPDTGQFTFGDGSDGGGDAPGGGSSAVFAKEITAAEARGNSRAVTSAEYQTLAAAGQTKLDAMAANSSPTIGLDENWASVKSDAYAQVTQPWGGATYDSHTGASLPQGADAYSISAKGPDTPTISIPENATAEEFGAAMDQARASFGPILERESHYLGVFHDDENSRIDIDPAIVVTSLADVESVGAATYATGGAYSFADGNGYWPPHVSAGS